ERGGEPAASGSLEPRSRDRLQAQPRAARPGRPLLAFQPLSDRSDQVIVGKLIIRLGRTGSGLARCDSFEIGGRDQAEIGIEDSCELGKVDRAVGVTRRLSQESTGVGAAANHRGRRRQQSLEYRLSRGSMNLPCRWRRGGLEGLLEKLRFDAF